MTPSAAEALAPADRTRLAKFLALLGSEHAGERDAAGLAADRLVRDRGLSWHTVLGDSTAPAAPKPAQRAAAGWRADLELCRAHLDALNPWEQNFALSVSEKRNSLSPGQQAKLAQIAIELRAQGLTV